MLVDYASTDVSMNNTSTPIRPNGNTSSVSCQNVAVATGKLGYVLIFQTHYIFFNKKWNRNRNEFHGLNLLF